MLQCVREISSFEPIQDKPAVIALKYNPPRATRGQHNAAKMYRCTRPWSHVRDRHHNEASIKFIVEKLRPPPHTIK